MISFVLLVSFWGWIGYGVLALIVGVGLRDLLQRKHTIQHNFPVIGHFRYFFEELGPPLRQYLVASNRDELPFNRRQRSWIYASSKKENNYQGFGSDQDFNAPGYIFIKHAMLPYVPAHDHPHGYDEQKHEPANATIPCAKVIGPHRRRPYRPASVVNISGMSFGSLSGAAIESLNKGAALFGCYHNTGEGAISPYHKNGAEIVLNIGTSYFGVRDEAGNFSMEKLTELSRTLPQLRMLELKLSQGAKPGKGGVLPASKITHEIAATRGVPMGQDVISPSYHSVFHDVPSMVDFIERMAAETGLPVGIKSAVGKLDMWHELAAYMKATGNGPDFITIDGGEGGTGAAPPAFADHVSLPFVFAFTKVYQIFREAGLTDRIVFIGSGKLGLPDTALMAFALGCDMVNIGRESMLSIGCVQTQLCHTNRCPTGVATQNKWLQGGLDPALKSVRFYQYVKTLSKEILDITHACGYEHPCQVTMEDVDVSAGDNNKTQSLAAVYGYQKAHVTFSGTTTLFNCLHLGKKWK
ncbi:FMN-binding glutamate synthase family protein [Siphonobacter aquaeclarae]|uniref:Glutamate synthase domain-containing protein 2 n=1 Tax=Siphonobacter aquaeclarae TaxID=563176 RepID=A0A1G9TCK2_9BACT|nr:FMN-binding glutamate synthase family protein [Siphonobacter aquaeclarae]SDM45431.1 Glutamate synthase domain-containing protein 2 [Siphonobacter aquaeclarae]